MLEASTSCRRGGRDAPSPARACTRGRAPCASRCRRRRACNRAGWRAARSWTWRTRSGSPRQRRSKGGARGRTARGGDEGSARRRTGTTKKESTHLGLGERARDGHERAREEALGAVRADEALEVGREAERDRLVVEQLGLARNDSCSRASQRESEKWRKWARRETHRGPCRTCRVCRSSARCGCAKADGRPC